MGYSFSELFAKKFVAPLHNSFVLQRRMKVLTEHILDFLPEDLTLKGLDVGCGNGRIACDVQKMRPEVKVAGLDVFKREDAIIDVALFDGKNMPFEDKSCDFVMLIDVLHHVDDVTALIEECVRVARKFILIVDHVSESWWDDVRLRFMDWVGNRGHGVRLPYHFLSKSDWAELYGKSGLECKIHKNRLGLYPWPFSVVFDGKLHFITKLNIVEK